MSDKLFWSWPQGEFTVEGLHGELCRKGLQPSKCYLYIKARQAIAEGVLQVVERVRSTKGPRTRVLRRSAKAVGRKPVGKCRASEQKFDWRYELPDSAGLWWMAVCQVAGEPCPEAVSAVWVYQQDGRLLLRHMEPESPALDIQAQLQGGSPHTAFGDVLWQKAKVPCQPVVRLAEDLEECALGPR